MVYLVRYIGYIWLYHIWYKLNHITYRNGNAVKFQPSRVTAFFTVSGSRLRLTAT